MFARTPSPPRAVAILLAAGDSERMGSPKALLEWRGRALLTHQLEEIQRSRVAECVVVLGRDADRLESLVRAPLRPGWKARAVFNPRHAEGRCSSILAGLTSLPARPEALLIASVDQPLEGRLLDALLGAAAAEWAGAATGERDAPATDAVLEPGRRTIVVPAFAGRRGHPPLFCGTLFPELLGIREETEGLRAVVRRLPGRVLELPWDSEDILVNLNTPVDRERAPGAGSRPGG